MSHGKPRDPRLEQRWRQRLDRWQRSGLSIRAFCQRHHLSEPSFYAWRRTLQLREATLPATAPVTFLPLHVSPDQGHDAPTPRKTASLELLLANGRCLRIPPDFDAEQLRRLVRLLEDEPC